MTEGAGAAVFVLLLLGLPAGVGFVLGHWRGRRVQSAGKADHRPTGKAATAPAEGQRGYPLGFYKRQHFTRYQGRIRDLKRAGNLAEAERLLLALIDVIEAEAAVYRCCDPDRYGTWAVAPSWYRELAIVYRKQKNSEGERAILERYVRNQPQAPDDDPLVQRLVKMTRDNG